MGTECRECVAALPHCHGSLIRHPGQQWQCTEAADCAHRDVLMHSLTIDCDAIGCECGKRDEHRLAV